MRILLRLLWLYRPYWGWASGGIVLSLAATLSSVALMAASGWFITAMGLAGVAGAAMNYYTPAAIIRALAMSRTGARYLERLVTHEATFRFLGGLRRQVFDRLVPLAPAGLEDLHGADVAARLVGDVDRLRDLYLRGVVPVVAGVLGALACVAVTAAMSGAVAGLLAVGLMVAGGGGSALSWLLGRRAARESVGATAALHRRAVDQIQGLAELQAFGADEAETAAFLDEARGLRAHQARADTLDAVARAATGLLASMAPVAVLVLGAPMVAEGSLGGADLMLLVFLCLASFETVAPLPAAFRVLPETLASARRLFTLIDRSPPEAAPITRLSPVVASAELLVTDLAFSHAAGPAVIDGLSLRVRAGERVALVGPSGAGKSTLVSLLTGLRVPTRGTVRVADHDLRDVEPETWRSAFAVAPQDARLFTGRLRDNLTLGAPEASDDAVRQACRIAQLDDLLARLPDGLDGFVGEAGTTVSGGEARRVGLARALLKPAPILILDEPTEGLDPAMERRFLGALDQALAGRTLILITHRRIEESLLDRVVLLPGR